MFVDRFSDEEAVQIAKKFCSIVVTKKNTFDIGDQISQEYMERGEGFVKFAVEFYMNELDYVELNDFSYDDGFSMFVKDETKQKEYIKFMYRKFGKEYLDALDAHYRKPIIERFNKNIAEHELMINEIVKE